MPLTAPSLPIMLVVPPAINTSNPTNNSRGVMNGGSTTTGSGVGSGGTVISGMNPPAQMGPSPVIHLPIITIHKLPLIHTKK